MRTQKQVENIRARSRFRRKRDFQKLEQAKEELETKEQPEECKTDGQANMFFGSLHSDCSQFQLMRFNLKFFQSLYLDVLL